MPLQDRTKQMTWRGKPNLRRQRLSAVFKSRPAHPLTICHKTGQVFRQFSSLWTSKLRTGWPTKRFTKKLRHNQWKKEVSVERQLQWHNYMDVASLLVPVQWNRLRSCTFPLRRSTNRKRKLSNLDMQGTCADETFLLSTGSRTKGIGHPEDLRIPCSSSRYGS